MLYLFTDKWSRYNSINKLFMHALNYSSVDYFQMYKLVSKLNATRNKKAYFYMLLREHEILSQLLWAIHRRC